GATTDRRCSREMPSAPSRGARVISPRWTSSNMTGVGSATPHLVGTLDGWRARVRRLKRDVYALYLACRDPRTPWYAKLLAAGVVAYAFSPIDLTPGLPGRPAPGAAGHPAGHPHDPRAGDGGLPAAGRGGPRAPHRLGRRRRHRLPLAAAGRRG